MSRIGILKSNKSMNMTEGSILPIIISFSVPLMVGNFFQLFYNTIDSWVVGNYVSKQALGAVGSTGSIVNMVVSFFSGMAGGAGAVISQYFGASDSKKVKSAVHSALILTLVIGIVSTAIGVCFTDTFLTLMRTPDDIFPEASVYLKIYFAGIIGLMFYNIEAGILRAVGDSTHPFNVLVVSSLVNIVLDLVFVLVFRMGVAGVAYATIISQFISAGLLLITLLKTNDSYRISFRDVEYSKDMFATILKIGMPSALQMGITAFSNIFVQAYINDFDTDIVTGWATYSKVDQVLMLPIQSIGIAITTFVGQNIGADRVDRAKRGIRLSTVLTFIISGVLMVPLLLFPQFFAMIFNQDEQVIYYGAYLLRLISPFYFFISINNVYGGALRGAGITQVPMLIMLGSFVAFRQAYLAVVNMFEYAEEALMTHLTLVGLSYPMGWIVCSAAYLLYFRFSHWETKSMTAKKKSREKQHLNIR